MTAIITFKLSGPEDTVKLPPRRIVGITLILNATYSTKFITRNNRVISIENNEIENIFLENMGK